MTAANAAKAWPIVPTERDPIVERRTTVAPHVAYLATLAPGTSRYTTARRLDTVAGIMSGGRHDAASFPWSDLEPVHVAALRAELAEHYAPSTANAFLAAVRGVFKALWRAGVWTTDRRERTADVERVRGDREPPGRNIPAVELTALVRAAAGHERRDKAARDVAVLAMLRAGLRLGELVALDVHDVDLDGDDGPSVLVRRGKGNRQRRVELNDAERAALADWLSFRGDWSGPLFVTFPPYRGGPTRARLGRESVRRLLARLAAAAGVTPSTPHDWRRSVIGDMLDAGTDLATVQRFVGHASANTTAGYDRRGRRAQRAAVDAVLFPRPTSLLPIPFPRRHDVTTSNHARNGTG